MRFGEQRVELVDLMLFCRQMYTLLKSGVPIMRGLAGLQESAQQPDASRAALGDVRESLEAGRELSLAHAPAPEVFSPFYMAMVRVGEIPAGWRRCSCACSTTSSSRRRCASASRRRCATRCSWCIAMVVAMVVVNVFVIPAFAKVFASFKRRAAADDAHPDRHPRISWCTTGR